MSIRTREVRYVECDGCGYTLGERYTTLELAYAADDRTRGKLTLHFHEASEEHDCLRYWVMGTGIMERSLPDSLFLSERGRQVILKATSGAKRV